MKVISQLFAGLLVVLANYTCALGQNNLEEMLNIENDVRNLNNNIIRHLNRKYPFYKNTELRIFHVYFLSYDGNSLTDDLGDNSFVNKLIPNYYIEHKCTRKIKILDTDAFICDSLGTLIGTSDGKRLYLRKNYNPNIGVYQQKIIDLYLLNRVDFLFSLDLLPVGTFIGIKSDEIIIFRSSNEELQTFTLDEFISCCWEDLIKLKDIK